MDLEMLRRSGRFAFVDGLTRGPPASLDVVRGQVEDARATLSGNGRTVLVVDGLDAYVAMTPAGSAASAEAALMALREVRFAPTTLPIPWYLQSLFQRKDRECGQRRAGINNEGKKKKKKKVALLTRPPETERLFHAPHPRRRRAPPPGRRAAAPPPPPPPPARRKRIVAGGEDDDAREGAGGAGARAGARRGAGRLAAAAGHGRGGRCQRRAARGDEARRRGGGRGRGRGAAVSCCWGWWRTCL